MSNVGTWMQRTAQDWIVLTQLTHNNATAVGVVMSLQFGPQLLMLPFSVASRPIGLDRRKLVGSPPSLRWGALALGLGLLTVSGARSALARVRLRVLAWMRRGFRRAGAPGVCLRSRRRDRPVERGGSEFDVVQRGASCSAPPIGGVLIAAVGTGWLFLINAASFAAVLGSLLFIRVVELHRSGKRFRGARGGLAEGFRYVAKRPDLKAILLMLF